MFNARTKYRDYEGTACADGADTLGLSELLKDRGVKDLGDYTVCGFRIGFGENHEYAIEKPGIVIYAARFDPPGTAQEVRAFEVDMTTAEFFIYFKRFDAVTTRKGIDLSTATVHPNELI